MVIAKLLNWKIVFIRNFFLWIGSKILRQKASEANLHILYTILEKETDGEYWNGLIVLYYSAMCSLKILFIGQKWQLMFSVRYKNG
jgi:hypothetical protein